MDDNQNRRLASFITSRDYFAQVSNQFAPNGVAQQKAARFAAVITEIQTKAAEQEGGIGQARQHTLGRKEARTELRLDLEAINRAARIMGLENEFPLPPEGNDKELLNAARAFTRNALPLKAQFIAHEMPEDFLEDLAADIAAFEAAIAKQSDARGGHVAASEGLEDLFDEGTELQRDLDGFMRNKFANNAEVLAEWTRASHVERAPRRKKPEGGSTPSTPTDTHRLILPICMRTDVVRLSAPPDHVIKYPIRAQADAIPFGIRRLMMFAEFRYDSHPHFHSSSSRTWRARNHRRGARHKRRWQVNQTLFDRLAGSLRGADETRPPSAAR